VSTRLDLTLQKHPDHEDGIRLLASRDPSSNLKYLDWAAKVLASGQALAPEIADVVELFHQFNGASVPRHSRHSTWRSKYVRPDIYSYRPQDLASLRDLLLKMKRAKDRKRKKRERLYRIEGSVEVDVVYDSDDLIVRHIKNKQASVHYGLGTKWCISMLRESYFEDYETHNATFFFLERKVPKRDEFDKVAIMMPRIGDEGMAEAFTSIDRRFDMMVLAGVYGPHVFHIYREIWERSKQYPGSAMACVYNGNATKEQIESVYAMATKGKIKSHEMGSVIESICCNDSAPWSVLEEILRRAPALSLKHGQRHRSCSYSLLRTIEAALVIHPQVPAEAYERLLKDLRRRHVDVSDIRRIKKRSGQVGVEYASTYSGVHKDRRLIMRNGRYYRRPRTLTLSALRTRAASLERRAVRMWKTVKTMERKKKLAEAKRLKAAER
jgi:hypothetical protein